MIKERAAAVKLPFKVRLPKFFWLAIRDVSSMQTL
jgi:hypothetical protein